MTSQNALNTDSTANTSTGGGNTGSSNHNYGNGHHAVNPNNTSVHNKSYNSYKENTTSSNYLTSGQNGHHGNTGNSSNNAGANANPERGSHVSGYNNHGSSNNGAGMVHEKRAGSRPNASKSRSKAMHEGSTENNMDRQHGGREVAGGSRKRSENRVDSSSMNTKFLYNVIMNGTKSKVKRDSFSRTKTGANVK
jgi:hypothetical protein